MELASKSIFRVENVSRQKISGKYSLDRLGSVSLLLKSTSFSCGCDCKKEKLATFCSVTIIAFVNSFLLLIPLGMRIIFECLDDPDI